MYNSTYTHDSLFCTAIWIVSLSELSPCIRAGQVRVGVQTKQGEEGNAQTRPAEE